MNSVINSTDSRYVTILKNISEELNVSQKQNEKKASQTLSGVLFLHKLRIEEMLQSTWVLRRITSTHNHSQRLLNLLLLLLLLPLFFFKERMAMRADHIMSSGNVCTAIKPGSTSMYMCKTHFPEQQGQGMKGKVRKFQLIVSSIQAQAKKISQNHSKTFSPYFLSSLPLFMRVCRPF